MAPSTIYERMGGVDGCRQLAEALYARIGRDPRLRPFFPGKTFTCAIEAFSAFLVQFLGGPSEHTQDRWFVSLDESHRRFKIGEPDRSAWLQNMIGALDDVPFDPHTRTALREYFEHASAYLVNNGSPKQEPCAIGSHELAARWTVQLSLDDTVATIRTGDAVRAISLAESLDVDDSLRIALLCAMLESQYGAFANYVHGEIRRAPHLVRAAYNGRMLLHVAAACGLAATVELLLECGADPNAGRHPVLYCLANQFTGHGGGTIARTLVRSGARVDACDNVKRCTALHMAARRDHVEIAEALLDCGADIEARDSAGETPLRRAVNTNRVAVAALLVQRGADVYSVGSKRLTPLQAARSEAMRKLLAKS